MEHRIKLRQDSNLQGAIERLKDPKKGHYYDTLFGLCGVLNSQKSDDRKFSVAFDPHKRGFDAELFEQYIDDIKKNHKYPTRMYVPLILNQDHVTALVVDIDKNGKCSTLFFNSLGDSPVYSKEAQPFLKAIEKHFPNAENKKTTHQFQHTARGDGYCGDWSLWFLEKAQEMHDKPLSDIKNAFDNMPPQAIPDPKSLRLKNIRTLQSYENPQLVEDNTVATTVTPLKTPKNQDLDGLIASYKKHFKESPWYRDNAYPAQKNSEGTGVNMRFETQKDLAEFSNQLAKEKKSFILVDEKTNQVVAYSNGDGFLYHGNGNKYEQNQTRFHPGENLNDFIKNREEKKKVASEFKEQVQSMRSNAPVKEQPYKEHNDPSPPCQTPR